MASSALDNVSWIVAFFDLPPAVMLVFVLVHGGVVALAVYFTAMFVARRYPTVKDYLPVAPFFVAVTTIFSFLLAFHASETWQVKKRALEDASQMHLNIQRLANLWSPREGNDPIALQELRTFVQSAIKEEWLSSKNLRASPAATKAWQNLRALNLQSKTTPAAQAAATRAQPIIAEIEQLRARKFHHAPGNSSFRVWIALLVLGILSHISIALVHLNRPKALAIAVSCYALTTSIVYFLIAADEVPYRDATMFMLHEWTALLEMMS